MSLKLTAHSFLLGLRQSGLIEADALENLLKQLRDSGVDQSSAVALAQAIVRQGQLTSWQAEQLLQGRSKGFVLGRYRLLSLLGTGENSAVFLARHTGLDRLCAIKILPAHRVRDTSYLGRFFREARAVASLDHPNIVRAYDVDSQKNAETELHFLVLEYIEGTSLDQLVQLKGGLEPDEAIDIIRQAAEGLAHAHRAGLIHRDIKPANLLIDENGTVKLLDLGLARYFKSSDEESLTLKHDEKVLGTADYLSPEQAVDSHNVDARTDVYSLGCTLFYTLTGRPPFDEGTLVQRMLAHQTKPVPRLIDCRPELPPTIDQILQRMMAKKASDRFPTASEAAEELTLWLLSYAGPEWRQKHRTLALSSGAAILPAAALAPAATLTPVAPAVEDRSQADASSQGKAVPDASRAQSGSKIRREVPSEGTSTPSSREQRTARPATTRSPEKQDSHADRDQVERGNTVRRSNDRPRVAAASERPGASTGVNQKSFISKQAPGKPAESSRTTVVRGSSSRSPSESPRIPNRSEGRTPGRGPRLGSSEWLGTALLGAGLSAILMLTAFWLYSLWRPSSTTTAHTGNSPVEAAN